MKVYQLLACLLIVSPIGFSQPVGYNFAKQIVIDATQVPGTTDLSNFAILFSVTDPNLRTVVNGGGVENANGYDFLFTSSDCMTFLDHQMERYNPVTGEVLAWVRIPVLGATANTTIHLYYGNSSIVSSHATTATWNANYFGVYHFNNVVTDASAGGNHLTNVNSTNLTTSIIGEGRDLDNNTNVVCSNAAGQHLVVPNGVFAGVTNFTWSGWVYLDRDATNWERIFDFGQSTNVNFFFTPSIDATSPSQTRARITTGGFASEQGPSIANSVANTGAWIYWAVTLEDATNPLSVYKNGAFYGSAAGVTLRPNNMEATTANYFGRSLYGADHYIDAKFDEFRLSHATHSADWIATEYNNQSSPSTFYSVSAQMNAIDLCVVLPVELINFNAIAAKNKEVELVWETESEMNNDYFTVERSPDALNWEKVKIVDGAGNDSSLLHYATVDTDPLPGVSYYRLKQTDFNGHFSYSEIKSVYIRNEQIVLYPNPADKQITIISPVADGEFDQVAVYDVLGQEVIPQIERINDGVSLVMDVSYLTSGIYYVKTNTAICKFYKQ